MIQSVLSSSRTLYMLMKLREYNLQGLIKVTCNYVNILGVDPLGSFMVFSRREHHVYIGVGWNIHSGGDYYC